MSITSEGQRRMATPIANGTNDRIESTTKPPKVSTPETFDGNQGRLEDFKLQVQLYFFFNRAQFATESEKVLYASSFLRGKAARGFRPYLKDWLDHQEGDQQPKTETRTIFHDYDQFEIKLEELYGIPNEESHADRHIRRLRQVTSVSSYASEFQGYAADLEWNDAALRSQFYLGLKEVVKAELSRGRTTRSLAAMMKEAKEIDERLQELRSDRMIELLLFDAVLFGSDRVGLATLEQVHLSPDSHLFRKSLVTILPSPLLRDLSSTLSSVSAL
ncbi:hypothetical protein KC340_g18762 [Hortaea werneckii]|nr:hypothetical protein KC342_g18909 [Hortaea werneckii]KAI7054045.1 hypothetical protein KC339_g18608 [Hortaea werneckii]KAI7200669.1 hypothetical protein KC365_g18889 [Hortaea werneckii]KAI7281564.1 hypothetical protein KC340_g18762 [Hortaea werneckii]KAI7364119.1 hypothetical protein KC328_g18818 [Hortaea werneckii]